MSFMISQNAFLEVHEELFEHALPHHHEVHAHVEALKAKDIAAHRAEHSIGSLHEEIESATKALANHRLEPEQQAHYDILLEMHKRGKSRQELRGHKSYGALLNHAGTTSTAMEPSGFTNFMNKAFKFLKVVRSEG